MIRRARAHAPSSVAARIGRVDKLNLTLRPCRAADAKSGVAVKRTAPEKSSVGLIEAEEITDESSDDLADVG